LKASRTSSSKSQRRPDDKTAPVPAKHSVKPGANGKPDAKTAAVSEGVKVKPDDKTDAVSENVKMKPGEKTDAVSENVKMKPGEKTDAVSENVKMKPGEKTDAVSENVKMKPDAKTAAVSERLKVKPDDKTAAVSERIKVKPDDKTDAVSDRIKVKPDDKTAAVSELVKVKPEEKTSPISERVPSPARSKENGPEIPNYKTLHSIGKGGYGEVWLARSVTGTLRAIKIVRRSDFDNEKAFEREFEGIQHYESVSKDDDGLVDVLHVGRDDEQGFYYYVMELADDVSKGREINVDDYVPLTLSRKLRRGEKAALPDCLDIGKTLCEALGAMHLGGLTHRDVKPSSIIYVRGKPQLADPGLVASAGQDTFVGTEGYIPPEGPGSHQADLYSLGMVLYEMNTGKDRMDFPELPTIIDPEEESLRERSELNTIICKTCAPRPKQRFADSRSMLDPLRLIGNGKRPSGHRSWKFAAAAAVVLLLGGGVVAGMMLAKKDENSGKIVAAPAIPKPTGQEPPEISGVLNPGANPDADPGTGPDPAAAGQNGEQPPAVASTNNPIGSPDPNPTPGPVAVASVDQDHVLVVPGSNPGTTILNPGPSPGSPTTNPNPAPSAVIGNLRIISFPSDAIVYVNDEEIGATPVKMSELPADDYKVRVVKDGYRDFEVLARVVVGDTALVDAELLVWRPPLKGEAWKNSVGIAFQPLSPEAAHRTAGAIQQTDFDHFSQTVGENKLNFKIGADAVVFADASTRQSFCDWMTAKDRADGYLGEKLVYMQDVAEPLDGSPDLASFFAIVGEHRFGRVVISSIPSGAEVYRTGKKIGLTPVAIDDMELGPVAYEIRMAGFKAATVEGLVNYLEPLNLEAELEENQSVVFDRKWKNHIGMEFVPFEKTLVSIYETRVQDYEIYWDTLGTEDRFYETDFDQGPDHPVVNIRREQAKAFCEWLTEVEREQERIQPNHVYRLLTDQEWSHLAGLVNEVGGSPESRDGKVRGVFPWGKSWPPRSGSGNFADSAGKSVRVVRAAIPGYTDGFARTAPVGSFDANEHGVFDLAGNVWEFVGDNYSSRPGGGPYPVVMRGGSWQDSRKENFETAHRNVTKIDRTQPLWGFRVVLARENEPIEIQSVASDEGQTAD
jgi:serine/threonine protein kinase/formylglycine-generating enzyme required for sulfatase activity